jgi:putative membrane protein
MSTLDDPRVLFAAERTLLAWVRTGLTSVGLGFLVARFDLFLRFIIPQHEPLPPHGGGLVIGIVLVVTGALLCLLAAHQFRRLARTLQPSEIPPGYSLALPLWTGLAFGGLGLVLAVYLVLQSRG